MFSLKSTVVIIIFLVAPFLLRTLGLEPFPAVELPSGGILIRESSNTVVVTSTKVYGVNFDDSWTELDQNRFMYPIPVHYSSYLYLSNFGTEKEYLYQTKRRYKLIEKYPVFKQYLRASLTIENPSNGELNERAVWLKNKFEDQGMRADSLKIVTVELTISTKDGTILKRRTIDEKITHLNRKIQ